MTDDAKNTAEVAMKKAIDALVEDLKKVRTGRATVAMLDPVMVNYYGTPTPLNQVASISTPDARSFLITPWEASVLKEIEQGIVKASLGLAPQNDGKAIRLKVPELTEERRKDLVKNVKKLAEDARVSVRMARRSANDEFKKLLKDKTIGEDDEKRALDEVQKLTDSFISKIDTISEDKEKDLLQM